MELINYTLLISVAIIAIGIVAFIYHFLSFKKEMDEYIGYQVRNDESTESRIIKGGHTIHLCDEFKELCRRSGINSKVIMLNILEKEVELLIESRGVDPTLILIYSFENGFYFDTYDIEKADSFKLYEMQKLLEEFISMDNEMVRNLSIHLISVKS